MKILIVQTAYIGDVVLATALVNQIKEVFPNSKLHMLVRNGNEGILKNHPHLEKTWVWNKSQNKTLSLLKLILKVREEKYDYTLNIQRFFNSGLITAFSGAKTTVGFDKNPLSIFFTKKIKHSIPFRRNGIFLHEVDRNAQLLASITNKDIPAKKPSFFISDDTNKKVNQLTANFTRPYLVLAPASVWFTKQWPKEKWIELKNALNDKYELMFIGAPNDASFVAEIIGDSSHCTNLCGKLSLIESAALMQKAHRVIANDSAPLHLASGVNAPTTAIFCSTIPEFGYGPLSDIQVIVQRNQRLECTPCGLHGKKDCPLGHFKCAKDIEIHQIISTL